LRGTKSDRSDDRNHTSSMQTASSGGRKAIGPIAEVARPVVYMILMPLPGANVGSYGRGSWRTYQQAFKPSFGGYRGPQTRKRDRYCTGKASSFAQHGDMHISDHGIKWPRVGLRSGRCVFDREVLDVVDCRPRVLPNADDAVLPNRAILRPHHMEFSLGFYQNVLGHIRHRQVSITKMRGVVAVLSPDPKTP
jgi:hypothetical protein